ncbi:hypothetical protein [Tissierella praeacuta]|uniref:hypothetical protein n=1 Tax=Tissierella praeacuta TaxID=43131 RepID=UPI001C100ED9|nr:hypothetical protein [Tissierella praeacuta]MBU5254984.1 hypothetical protein [Tissierella praeacuta]
MENKAFLLNLLELTNNIIEGKDEAVVIANKFNSNELEEKQKEQLSDTILSFTDADKIQHVELLKQIISVIDILNKKYLLSIVELKSLDFANKSLVKKIVSEKLSDETIAFDNEVDKYTFYSLLVHLTISLKEPSLIKLAIDKIQTM